jgi:uncharacterized protein
MAIVFLDSSAAAKAYVAEQGSPWVRSMLDPLAANELYASVLTGVEVMSALVRRRRMGSLGEHEFFAALAEFRDDWQHLYSHVGIDERVVDRAMTLAEAHGLRAYDAMQLALATFLHEQCVGLGLSLMLVSADDELNTAAVTEGLDVENPNLHP